MAQSESFRQLAAPGAQGAQIGRAGLAGLVGLVGLAGLYPAAALMLQSGAMRVYEDPSRGFTFSYPTAFGATSRGTNDGFGDRVAAVRFAAFPARLGGEAVLTRGFPLLDLQAAGGLYDALTLEIFPDRIRPVVVAQLTRLTPANLCAALAVERHVDAALPAFASLAPSLRQAIGQIDSMFNTDPRVVECRIVGEAVVFDKERKFAPGYPVQHVYGAVRFLPEPFSTFQLVAGGEAPEPGGLAAITAIVDSFRLR